jgi:type 1 glutamine amidotransferase
MKNLIIGLILTAFFLSLSSFIAKKKEVKILVFSCTKGFRHKSIEPGLEAIKKIGKEKGYTIVHSENPADFNDKNLKQFKVLLFLNPTGKSLFDDAQKAAFKKYINRGGGFVGVHAATDCNYDWEWYGKLVGGFFAGHPKVQEARLDILDANHPATKDLPNPWMHTDEWYNFKDFNKDVKVIMTVDEKSYTGGKMPDFHPMAWYHEFDGGKVFYTGLGHTIEDFQDELFLKHLTGGIEYVLK